MAKVISISRLTPSLVDVRLARPADFTHRPGQFAAVWMPDRPKQKRLYSIASPPGTDELRFVVEVFAQGAVSPALASLGPGDEVGLGPGGMGQFVRAENGSDRDYLAGWGSGVAPLLAMGAGTLRYVCLKGEASAALAPPEATRTVAARGDAPEGMAEEAAGFERIYLAGPHRFVRGLADELAARGVASGRVHLEQWG